MPGSSSRSAPKPYDAGSLERSALHYVERYATTRAKLAAYLRRKLGERGWAGDTPAEIDLLVQRFADRGYVNDAEFARAQTDSLLRRGYGGNRIMASLRAAGIEEKLTQALREDIGNAAERSALAFARRRKIGPFASKPPNSAESRRAFAAMLRAGHDFETARRILASSSIADDFIDVGIFGDVDSE
jgi:regulatory protein